LVYQPEAARRTLRNVHNLLRSFTDSQIVDAATGSTAAELRAYVTLLMKKVDDR